MSTLVVVKKGDEICIGADTLFTGPILQRRAEFAASGSKLLPVGESFIAVAGSLKISQAMRAALASLKSPKLGSVPEIFSTFNDLREILISRFGLNGDDPNHDVSSSLRAEFLIANSHGIFGVDYYGAAVEYTKFWAKGTGDELALGAIHASYERDQSARAIALVGLQAAAEFDGETGPPFEIHELKIGVKKGRR